MEWKTHMLSGAIVGFSVSGGDWKAALVGGIAGILPDIDEPNSKVGRVLPFLSIPVSLFCEHRTFTHSLLFTIIMGSITYYFFGLDISLITMLGILAHIVGDMLTGTVNFYYPSKKWIGIPISQSMFVVIDRITRYTLLLVGVLIVFEFYL